MGKLQYMVNPHDMLHLIEELKDVITLSLYIRR